MSGDSPLHDPDDGLLADLHAAVAEFDPLPERLMASAKAAYGWRTIDEELAQLQFDSLASSEALVRSGQAVVHLTFWTSHCWIEVDITAEQIMGQVNPPATEIKLTSMAGGDLGTSCDEIGQFSFGCPRSGPVRLIAKLDGVAVSTEWFTI